MFMVSVGEQPFPRSVLNFIYKLVFHGLKKISFDHVSYFALVFAAQMTVLEFFEDFPRVELMLVFLLHKFLPFTVIKGLRLRFDRLFESAPTQGNSPDCPFLLQSDLNLSALLRSINTEVCSMINQITFCRSELTQEMMNLMVIEPAQQKDPPSKDELRNRYFKIETVRNVDLLDSLLKVSLNRGHKVKLIFYNDLNILKKHLLGILD